MKCSVRKEIWPLNRPFRIAGRVMETADVIVVELSQGGWVGRGEAAGVFYQNETCDSMIKQIEAVASALRAGVDRQSLQLLLPPGGARNALDCALWELEARTTGRSVWELSGVKAKPVETVYTIGIEATPELMAQHAAEKTAYPLLKVKLDATQPLKRMQAIRAARPDVRIVVDANQGWTFELLKSVAQAFAELGVQMIEQPLPRSADAQLEHYKSPVPLCADESCLHIGELEAAAARYQMINIKLDKTGGLTPALKLAAAAHERGMGVMVGCMGGTSLAMAPAFVLACVCDFVDIDGPLLQKSDRLPGLDYRGGAVSVFGPEVWG